MFDRFFLMFDRNRFMVTKDKISHLTVKHQVIRVFFQSYPQETVVLWTF